MFSRFHMYYDDVTLDEEFESSARTITEADIVNFAGVSGDFNPIHTDHEFARSTPWRKPIAHGLLVLSVATGLAVSTPPMRTIAFVGIREWMFRGPVFIGDTIRMVSRLKECIPRSRNRRADMIWYRSVVNQAGKIVQDGTLATIVEGRAMLQTPEAKPPEMA